MEGEVEGEWKGERGAAFAKFGDRSGLAFRGHGYGCVFIEILLFPGSSFVNQTPAFGIGTKNQGSTRKVRMRL